MKRIFTLLLTSITAISVNAQYFSDDWTGGTLTSNNAWTSVTSNVSYDWLAQDLGSPGNFYAKMENWDGTNNYAVTSWLVTPEIDLSGSTSPTLTFSNAYNFLGTAIEVYVSTDFTGGDPASVGTWIDLSSMVNWSTGGFNWANSGDIDLTSYISSNTYIAFKYIGSASDGSAWQIDNFDISEQGAGPGSTTIYDIQYSTASPADSPYLGQTVTTYGIVTGIIQNGPDADAYFIQDGIGAWNGLYIYDTDASVSIGDSIEVTGEVDEFNLGTSQDNVTELKNVSSYTVISSGNSVPAVTTVSSGDAGTEQYEGVLILVDVGECTNNSEGFGLWSINDGSGVIKGDDDIFAYHTTAVVGLYYDVTGIGHYSFDEAKILPRDINDITERTDAGINDEESSFSIYPNPATDIIFINASVNSSVEIYDLTGAIIFTGLSLNPIDVSSFAPGVYQIVVTQNSIKSTQKLIIQ